MKVSKSGIGLGVAVLCALLTLPLKAIGQPDGVHLQLESCDKEITRSSSVRVDAIDSVDLANNSVLASVLRAAANFAEERCARGTFENIGVKIYHPRYAQPWDDFIWQGVTYAIRWRNTFGDKTLSDLFTNNEYQLSPQLVAGIQKKEKEAESKSIEQATKRTFLNRSIAGFTLGVSLDDAEALVRRGVLQKQFALLEPEFNWTTYGRAVKGEKIGLIANGTAGVEPIASVRPLGSEETKRLILRFYKSRLYTIVTEPHTSKEVMYKALVAKYGEPLMRYRPGLMAPLKPNEPGIEVWWKGPESLLAWKRAGAVWVDSRTVIQFLEFGNDQYLLLYQDTDALLNLWKAVEIQQQKAQKEKEELSRKQKRGPKEY